MIETAYTTNPAEFSAKNNAWCIMAVTDVGNLDSGTPLFFTRNIGPDSSKPENQRLDRVSGGNSKYPPNNVPFGDKMVVVIGRGGQARIRRASEMSQSDFNPGHATNVFLAP